MHLKYCKILEIDNYRLIFVLDKSRLKKYSFTKFANFLIVLRAEIPTTFGSKMVAISARNNSIVRKFANFVRLFFPYFAKFRDQILKF